MASDRPSNSEHYNDAHVWLDGAGGTDQHYPEFLADTSIKNRQLYYYFAFGVRNNIKITEQERALLPLDFLDADRKNGVSEDTHKDFFRYCYLLFGQHRYRLANKKASGQEYESLPGYYNSHSFIEINEADFRHQRIENTPDGDGNPPKLIQELNQAFSTAASLDHLDHLDPDTLDYETHFKTHAAEIQKDNARITQWFAFTDKNEAFTQLQVGKHTLQNPYNPNHSLYDTDPSFSESVIRDGAVTKTTSNFVSITSLNDDNYIIIRYEATYLAQNDFQRLLDYNFPNQEERLQLSYAYGVLKHAVDQQAGGVENPLVHLQRRVTPLKKTPSSPPIQALAVSTPKPPTTTQTPTTTITTTTAPTTTTPAPTTTTPGTVALVTDPGQSNTTPFTQPAVAVPSTPGPDDDLLNIPPDVEIPRRTIPVTITDTIDLPLTTQSPQPKNPANPQAFPPSPGTPPSRDHADYWRGLESIDPDATDFSTIWGCKFTYQLGNSMAVREGMSINRQWGNKDEIIEGVASYIVDGSKVDVVGRFKDNRDDYDQPEKLRNQGDNYEPFLDKDQYQDDAGQHKNTVDRQTFTGGRAYFEYTGKVTQLFGHIGGSNKQSIVEYNIPAKGMRIKYTNDDGIRDVGTVYTDYSNQYRLTVDGDVRIYGNLEVKGPEGQSDSKGHIKAPQMFVNTQLTGRGLTQVGQIDARPLGEPQPQLTPPPNTGPNEQATTATAATTTIAPNASTATALSATTATAATELTRDSIINNLITVITNFKHLCSLQKGKARIVLDDDMQEDFGDSDDVAYDNVAYDNVAATDYVADTDYDEDTDRSKELFRRTDATNSNDNEWHEAQKSPLTQPIPSYTDDASIWAQSIKRELDEFTSETLYLKYNSLDAATNGTTRGWVRFNRLTGKFIAQRRLG